MKSLRHYRYMTYKISKNVLRGSALLGLLAVRSFVARCRPKTGRAGDECDAREAKLDESLKETFPASDPPSHSAPSV